MSSLSASKSCQGDNTKLLLDRLKSILQKGFSSTGTQKWIAEQKELICETVELMFGLHPWWEKDYFHKRQNKSAYKSLMRNDVYLSEDGLFANLITIFDKIRRREYVSAEIVIRSIWDCVNNYKKRPEFDVKDKNFDLIAQLEDSIQRIDKNLLMKRKLSLCCSSCRLLPLRPVACKGKNCQNLIELYAVCYEFSEPSPDYLALVCSLCYNKNADFVEVKKRKKNSVAVEWKLDILPRQNFRKTTLSRDVFEAWEPMIICHLCERSYHQMCVMFDQFNMTKFYERINEKFSQFNHAPFICNTCVTESIKTDMILTKFNLSDSKSFAISNSFNYRVFSVDSILPTRLSNYMENSLQTFMFNECHKMQKGLPASFKVRVMCARSKVFQVKPRMKMEYEKVNRATKIEYQYKSIMVFQEDPELKTYYAIFNLIVHEYPSRGVINISYIDSVKLFQPAALRSQFYKHVVLYYLDFMQKYYNYRSLHIWVCPPIPGDEYVFYGRPPSNIEHRQKGSYPGLIKWYRVMMDNCKEAGIIESYFQIGPQKNPYNSILDIPYMVDDFWVSRLEDLLEEHEKNRNPPRRSPGTSNQSPTLETRLSDVVATECRNLLFTAEFKVNFDDTNNGNLLEGDDCDIFSSYMGSRDNFLLDCRESRKDFSDNRKAAYSTMLLFTKMAQEAETYKCKECSLSIRSGFYCVECDVSVFCSLECGLQHKIHIPTVSLKKFRCANPDAIPIGDNRSNLIATFNANLICRETFNLLQVKEIIGKIQIVNECLSLMRAMLSPQYKDNDKVGQEHRQSCFSCDLLWTVICRHKKICIEGKCPLKCCPGTETVDQEHLDWLKQRSLNKANSRSYNIATKEQMQTFQANILKRQSDSGISSGVNSSQNSQNYPHASVSKRRCGIEPSEVYVNPDFQSDDGAVEIFQIFNSSATHRLQIQNNSIFQDDSGAAEGTLNGFMPLMNYTDSSTSLTSASPFTDTLQMQRQNLPMNDG